MNNTSVTLDQHVSVTTAFTSLSTVLCDIIRHNMVFFCFFVFLPCNNFGRFWFIIAQTIKWDLHAQRFQVKPFYDDKEHTVVCKNEVSMNQTEKKSTH